MTVTFQHPPANLEALTNEKSFQSLVVDALRTMKWVVLALEDTRAVQVGSPDLWCIRAGRGELIELKIKGNYLSAGQKRWRERWLPEGTEAHLIYNTTADWERLMGLMT